MERKGGIWFARGGTSALIDQLVSLGERQGIQFLYNRKALGFNYSSTGSVSSVLTEGQEGRTSLPCDVVVWGGDPRGLYRVLGREKLSLVERARAKTVRSSMGLYVLYFKTKATYPDVAHHTIVLSQRWEQLLKEIFSGDSLPPDPSLYLHRPAATDSSMSRGDGDVFYVLAPVPHLGNYDRWALDEPRFRTSVLSILEQRVLPGLQSELEFAESVDPRYFRDSLDSPLGAGFSIAPLLSQSAWFRFHNRMDKIANLYLCGAGVHPGGGLPGVVTSAKVVDRMIRSDMSKRQKNSSSEDMSPTRSHERSAA
jgi:phytoene desaturase